jgi:hypothetical protein
MVLLGGSPGQAEAGAAVAAREGLRAGWRGDPAWRRSWDWPAVGVYSNSAETALPWA